MKKEKRYVDKQNKTREEEKKPNYTNTTDKNETTKENNTHNGKAFKKPKMKTLTRTYSKDKHIKKNDRVTTKTKRKLAKKKRN